MKRRFVIMLGSGLLLLGLVTLLSYRQRPMPVPASQPPLPAEVRADAPVAPVADPEPKPSAPGSDVNARGELLKKYLLAEHPASIETRIETRDPFIARFRMLDRRKVLLKAEEKSELADMLSDKEKALAYQDHLNRVEFPAQAIADEQMYRLFILQYFETDLRTHKDPGLVEYLINFVLADNFAGDLSQDVKKVLAYEKIKVIGFLHSYSPDSLPIIKRRMVGLRHENLLRDALEQLPAA